jgi:hypothetical protein
MKTVTSNISDPVTGILRATLRDRRPVGLGGPIASVSSDDDLLGEMLEDSRD